ncbi:MTH1187 family thiamine-binding protein [Haloplanus rubicundus]|uniref:Thiamine-binding protein n=1 Tax=Haloplanus rubicundus TaxID=1547898 RepID=A0A345EHV7_9EURY|nr:MTH1187 family thiamine-binding protein [Haloplanus rubicundus]AXG11779.1 thiamine-binding protein [Haloplanus rubicundus]
MTVIARFEVIPVHDGSLSDDIAQAIEALEEYDISYELTATDTVIEADDVDTVFDAVRAAHNAVGGDRVISSLEIDELRDREQHVEDRVESVASILGRDPKRDRGV